MNKEYKLYESVLLPDNTSFKFTPMMKNSMIIKLLLVMHTICARVVMENIKNIKTMIFTENKLLIHPDESLSPLQERSMRLCGYMGNKRLYASEINTVCSLKKTDDVTDGLLDDDSSSYEYIRNPAKDTVYEDICEDKEKNEYLVQFHKLLIKMFPSADGSLSIVSGLPEGFTSFLRKEEVQPQSMRILAALFLLSEQVYIPITTEEKKLVLKSADGTPAYIDQSLRIFTKDQTKSKSDLKKWCEDIGILIEFLKKYIGNGSANTSEIKGLPTVPTSYEQFMTGEFLNTPQFLVQSYIYEFIDTEENYIEFVEAVYILLNDQIKNKNSTEENKARCNELLGKLFIEESKLSNVTDHTKNICDLNETVDKNRVCPFIDTTELPAYTRVKAYDRTTGKEIDDEIRKYSNCVEAGILGLVCCLVYDPVVRMYNTDHLSDNEETKPLKDFFRKYSEPREAIDYEMQQDWCRVVADLNNDKILYLKQKTNELDSSLLNILYVASDIAGNKEEVVNEIKHIESMCSKEEKSAELNIEESLNTIFRALSNNKNLAVESEGFKLSRREDGMPDLFGKFSVVYTFGEIKNGISMNITTQHMKLDLAENTLSKKDKADIIAKLTKIQKIYANPKNYTEFVIKHYIDIEMAKIETKYVYLLDPIKTTILDSIRAGGNDALKLFLCGRIKTTDYKIHIVISFLVSDAKNLKNDNSLIRMTDNIIGSVPLDDQHTRNKIIIGYICNPKAKEYYTKIDESVWDEIYIDNENKFSFLFLYLYKYNLEVDIILCFTKIMKVVNGSKNIYGIIISNSYRIIDTIIKELMRTKESREKIFTQMVNIIKETCKKLDNYKATNIYLSLFFEFVPNIAWPSNDGSTVIVSYLVHLFNIIDIGCLSAEDRKDIHLTSSKSSGVLEYLENNREIFCSNSENSEKYDKIIEILKTKITIEEY
ncbi:hypothetical protein NEIG_02530 [Nematocida sp. ERTm5]|nr:hypothetical protein NEIG_02530 [Nematocida sp. ERTm5]